MTIDELRKILRETGHVAEIDLEPTVKALSILLYPEEKKEPPKQVPNNRVSAVVAMVDGKEAVPTDARNFTGKPRLADIYANPEK